MDQFALGVFVVIVMGLGVLLMCSRHVMRRDTQRQAVREAELRAERERARRDYPPG